MKPYVPTKWQDHIVDEATGQVIQWGTPQSADNFNNIEDGIVEIGKELDTIKDSTPTPFETDVSLTKLEGCNGGFVECKEVKGRTEINLAKFNTPSLNTTTRVFSSQNLLTELSIGRVVTLINNTGREISYIVHEGTVWKREPVVTNEILTVVLGVNERISSIYGKETKGWTEANKNDLLKVMILDGTVTVAPNAYFEGMRHVGEEVVLHPSKPSGIVGQTVIEVEFNNIYNTKIGDTFTWTNGGSTTFRTNVKVIDIIGNNILKLDVITPLGGVIQPTELFIPNVPYYRIEILTKTENVCDNELVNGNWDIKNGLFVAGGVGNVAIKKHIYLSKGDWYLSNFLGVGDIWCCIYDVNKNFIKYRSVCSNGSEGKIIMEQDGYITFYKVGTSISLIQNIMLSEGTTKKAYTPYEENKTEILMKESLAEWNKVYTDGKVEVGTGEVILNGSGIVTEWYGQGINNLTSCFVFYDIKNIKPQCELKCNIIPNIYGKWDIDVEMITSHLTNSNIYMRVLNSKTGINTNDTREVRLQKIKTWLSNNNVVVYYEIEDSKKTYYNLNKTLIQRGFPNGYLQVNAGPIQPNVKGTYSVNTGERLTSIDGAVQAMNEQLGGVWKTLLALADRELRMKAIPLLNTNTNDDLKNKVNEILNVWR